MWKGHCVGRPVALIILAIGWIVGMALGSRAQAETLYIPKVSLSHRYDSNVFFTTKQNVPQGQQSWDLVTTLGADLNIMNKSRMGDTEVRAGFTGNGYAYNSDLSYVSTGIAAKSDLTPWMNEVLPGLQLRLADNFLYTPEPPAFITGGTPGESDVFARGIQATRANTYANNFSADGGYSFTRSVALRTNYTYSIRRTGQSFVSRAVTSGAPLTFFNTTVHNVSTGPAYEFDDGDVLYLKYTFQTVDQTPTTGLARHIQFTSHALQPQYETKLLPGWTATMSGGATVVEQAGSRAFFSGAFTVMNEVDRQTQVSISVSRQAAPAFFGIGGALISNVAQLTVGHHISRVVLLTVRGNYGHNESTSTTFRYETMGGSAVLDYNVTRSTKLSLSQVYNHYHYTGVFPFERFATMLTLSTEWN